MVEITITVPYADYQKAEKQAITQAGKEIKVDGFRAGHIPEALIRERLNGEALQGATLEFLIPQTYASVVQKEEIQVIAQPKVDIKSPVKNEGDDFVYTATVAVMPEVKMGDYSKIKVARIKPKLEPKQVEETIAMIMDRFAEWQDVARKAKKGDRVEIDFEGFDEEKKSIPNTSSKNHPLILGSGNMVPGFEDAIIGMEVGEEKEFDVTFPKDYHAESMQGKKVTFKLKLVRLEEKKEQKLDPEMVKKITGQEQSVEDFKKRVEEDLLGEMESRNQQDHDSKVVQEIIKITKVELPEVLVEDEIHHMLHEQKARVQQQGLTWEQYLAHIKKTEEDFEKDHKKAAEERLIARLGVHHIIKDSKIKVEDAEVEKKLDEMVESYPKEQHKAFRDHYKKDSDPYRNLKNSMAADRLIDMLSK